MKKLVYLLISALSLGCFNEAIASDNNVKEPVNCSQDVLKTTLAHCGWGYGCGPRDGRGRYRNYDRCRDCGRYFRSNRDRKDYCEDCCPRHGRNRGECQNPDKGPGYGRGEGRGNGRYRQDSNQ